jgi:DNA (cytosine-5)-methyltransferase 1
VGNTILSLFSGVGWLDLAVKLVLPDSRTVGYVEREASAAAALLARMEEQSLEPAPVWVGDIRELDRRELPPRGAVTGITAGFPCQDLSVAGGRAGINGRRSSLWSEVIRIAEILEPGWLFLENVSAIRSADGGNVETPAGVIVERALGTVLRDLAELGYDAEWLCIRASDVGAPHRRERWFCLAYSDRLGLIRNNSQKKPMGARTRISGHGREILGPERNGQLLAYSNIEGKRPEKGAEYEMWGRVADSGEVMADPGGLGFIRNDSKEETSGTSSRESGRRLQGELDRECSSMGDRDGRGRSVFPPNMPDRESWGEVARDAPEFLPAIEPGFRLLVDGCPVVLDEDRTDQLRAAGNGVVVLQAAVALAELLRRAYDRAAG